jgi:hypothetical protein
VFSVTNQLLSATIWAPQPLQWTRSLLIARAKASWCWVASSKGDLKGSIQNGLGIMLRNWDLACPVLRGRMWRRVVKFWLGVHSTADFSRPWMGMGREGVWQELNREVEIDLCSVGFLSIWSLFKMPFLLIMPTSFLRYILRKSCAVSLSYVKHYQLPWSCEARIWHARVWAITWSLEVTEKMWGRRKCTSILLTIWSLD